MRIYKFNHKENRILYLYCLGLAALFLAICSKSSPLYPFNDWYDANGFLTMGKGILDGLVPYRDLYEQKGPLLYFLHSICALIPGTHFLGVYFLETACLSVFLFYAARLLALYIPQNACYFLLPILTALLLSSESFCQGDSVEELCAPLVMLLLYYSIRSFAPGGSGVFSYRFLLAQGILAGCIFWMKYTLLGLHFAFMAFLFFYCLSQKAYARGLKSCLVFLLGMFLPSALILLFFAAHHALGDLWQVYFYNNMFLYDSSQAAGLFSRLVTILLRIGDTFLRNLQFSVFTIVGVLAFLISRRFLVRRAGKILLLLEAVFLASLIYTGSNFPYYGYILAVFPVLGIAALAVFVQFVWNSFHRIPRPGELFRLLAPFLPFGLGVLFSALSSYSGRGPGQPVKEKRASVPLSAPMLWFYRCLAVFVCLFFAFYKSPNTYMIGEERDSLAQYQFREIMLAEEEEPTLLNYGFLDGGFYTVCGITPTCKYFQMQNISYESFPDMMDSQNEVVRQQEVDFVIVRGEEIPELILEYYEPVAEARQLYEGANVRYVLLHKK